MKILNQKTITFTVAGVLSVLSATTFATTYFAKTANAAPQDVINIPDENLKKSLNYYCFNKIDSLDDITEAEALNCTQLGEEGTFIYPEEETEEEDQISNLEGLQYFTNLQKLYLWSDKISDLTLLRNLTKLQLFYLHSYSDEIEMDLTPLENLTNLQELSLYYVSDITHLQNLTKLELLDLSSNNISDLTPLRNLTNLQGLNLDANRISDLTPLQNLTNLTRLSLSHNNISDITPLQNLTNLTRLSLSHNNISDITPLKNLTNLTRLYLYDNNILDLTPLQNLTTLTFSTFYDQRPALAFHSSLIANPLRGIDGSIIPITETDFAINADANGNPSQNGGYIKFLKQPMERDATYDVDFQSHYLTTENKLLNGVLSFTYVPPVPEKVITHHEATDITNNNDNSNLQLKAPDTGISTTLNILLAVVALSIISGGIYFAIKKA